MRAPARTLVQRGLIAVAALAASCTPAQSTPTPPAPSATATASPTFAFPTIQPTRTSTPAPTPSPAAPLLEDLGDPLYQTEFLAADGWDLGSDLTGATSILNGALSLVINRPNSLRLALSPASPVGDFYLQAYLRPHVCTDEDEFGLVFRHQPNGDHYRVTITCDGGVRIRRVVRGAQRALLPDLEGSAAVFAGPLAENKLAVLAVGREFQVLINDIQVLQASDAELISGAVGIAAESDETGQTTILAERLSLYQAGQNVPVPASHTATPDA